MKLILTNQYSNLLLLVNGLAILLFYASRKKKSQRVMKFGNFETLQKVSKDNFLEPSKVILAVKMLAMTLLIIGISNPVIQTEAMSTNSDYVLAIDSSSSMLTSDIGDSRLSSAKDASINFVEKLSNSTSIGVVSFSGRIGNQTGLNDNKAEVKDAISSIEVGNYAGTAIGDAIYFSSVSLSSSSERKQVVLITDGVNNQGRSINESLNYAKEENITINTIGIGSQEEKSGSENVKYPNLNSSRLEEIAEETGGNYTTVGSEKEFEQAFLDFSKSKVEKDISDPILLLALLLFLAEWGLGTTKYDILP